MVMGTRQSGLRIETIRRVALAIYPLDQACACYSVLSLVDQEKNSDTHLYTLRSLPYMTLCVIIVFTALYTL